MSTYDELMQTCSQQKQTIDELNKKINVLEANYARDNLIPERLKPSTSQKICSPFILRPSIIPSANIFDNLSNTEYCTDEDEFPNISQKTNTKKKRKRNPTKSPPNRSYQVKPVEQKTPKIPLSPPINVSNVLNFYSFRYEILSVAKNSSVQFKALSNNDIKVTVQDANDYRNVKKLINDLTSVKEDN